MIIAWLVAFGVLYTAAHMLRLFLAWQYESPEDGSPQKVTVLQPVLSGDPELAATLAVGPVRAREAQFVWLVDTDDPEGNDIAKRLAARYANALVVVGRPPRNGENPKTLKLIRGLGHSDGQVIVVLDDDTTLPPGAIERLAIAAETSSGLATALPTWGRVPNTASEALVAGFVDGQGASAYLAMAHLKRNRTINGMAYAVDAGVLQQVGGFEAVGHAVTDDWAIARLFLREGRPIVQTTVPAHVAVTVNGPLEAARLLRRWTVFAHRYVAANLDGAMAGLVLLPAVLPLAGLILSAWTGPIAVAVWLLLLSARAELHRRLVRAVGGSGTAPLWSLVAAELALPLFSLSATLRPNRIKWRTRNMRIDGEGIYYE